jgi:predicted O-methyltransferase YrrM
MACLTRLVSIYTSRGIDVAVGCSPHRYANLPQIAATWFVRDCKSLTAGLGISLQDLYFFECLFERFRPRTCFVIGNSWGWSSIAISLIIPNSKVVAIDNAIEPQFAEGLNFTNQVAAEEGLNLVAVQASSPHDVPDIIKSKFVTPIDFVFVDGHHTKEQVFLDFNATWPFSTRNTIFIFHDAIDWKLIDGIERASQVSGMPHFLLDGTTSGMAIMFDKSSHPEVEEAISPFMASAAAKRVLNEEVYRKTNRRYLKIRSSVRKRINWFFPRAT